VTVAEQSVFEPQPFVSSSHWYPNSTLDGLDQTRGFLWATEQFTCASSAEVGPLRRSERLVEKEGFRWRRFELPHGRADDVKALEIELASADKTILISVETSPNLPSRNILEEVAFLQSQGDDDEAMDLLNARGFDEETFGGINILNLIDRHADLMYRLGQTEHSFAPYAEYAANGEFVRPLLRICRRWDRLGRSRTPPLSLIVRLAADLPHTIDDICDSPRVVLRRIRELEQAARIREIDQSCIRWLGRQPGRSLIQKAGTQQRLMAVVRKEDCDTPENRIVRDLLVRCRIAGRAYLARYADFQTHSRVKDVQKLVSLCEKHLKHSQLKGVRELVGIAQPNYVLQHEPRYRILWDAYLRLVRQEQVTQSVWQWRDRVWLEWLILGFASAITHRSFRSPAHRQGVGISPEPTTGEFIRCTTFGPWWPSVKNTSSVYLVKGSEIDACPLPDWVKEYHPDVAVVSPKRNLAVWTVLDSVNPEKTATAISRQLAQDTASRSEDDCQLMVFVGGGKLIRQGIESTRVKWACLPLMLQDSLDSWRQLISECLGDV
jgi:hypothetical protein